MWWQGLALSLVSTVSYGMLFNVPVRTLFAGGAVGAAGWSVLQIATHFGAQLAMATFLAATVVSLLSQLFSVTLRVPSTNFSVSGIIPLVPGSTAYRAMLAFVGGDYLQGITLAVKTSTEAGAIAAGLILGLSLFTAGKGFVNRYARTRAKAN